MVGSSDLAILNRFAAADGGLRIAILSTPKTGNTWLRWLLHYAFDLPIIDLPDVWDASSPPAVPARFVTHQHLMPCEDLLRWLTENKVVVLTTIRHPADAFLSWLHYAQWHDIGDRDIRTALRGEYGRPGKNTLRYLQYGFPQVYALSRSWSRLGAHVVRYEDMLSDPVAQLHRLKSTLGVTGDESAFRTAAFLSKPDNLVRLGGVDQRHLRSCTSRRWVKELPPTMVQLMQCLDPYRAMAADLGYDWNPERGGDPVFDYAAIDPFDGRERFWNGELVGPTIAKLFLKDVPDAKARWPDPLASGTGCFWEWLLEPCAEAATSIDHPPNTLTNIMFLAYKSRKDLMAHFPDVIGVDRMGYLDWFVGRAQLEMGLPWGMVAPAIDARVDLAAIRKSPISAGGDVGPGPNSLQMGVK